MLHDHCVQQRATLSKSGLRIYMVALFGKTAVEKHLGRLHSYVEELQGGTPIYDRDTSRRRKRGESIDNSVSVARALLNDRSSKVVMVPNARHPAHHMVQYGFVQAPDKGQFCLKWDNSYSRLRSKTLAVHYEVAEGSAPPSRWRAGPQSFGSTQVLGSSNSSKQNKFVDNFNAIRQFLDAVSGCHASCIDISFG